jgi:hypothetical protein
MPSRIRKQNRFGIHPNRFYLKLPKIMKTLACKALSNMLKSSNMTQRPSRNIYGRVFHFTPSYCSKKYLITSVVVTIPTKSSPSHTGKA